jgi:hypothetical protein
MEARSGEAQSGGVTIRMIGFEGRLQWRRHKLFKLRAKLVQCENDINYNELLNRRVTYAANATHPKFAIRSILVRRTRIEQQIKTRVPDAVQRLLTVHRRAGTQLSS